MKVVLTGGAGFIGSHIADALIDDSRIDCVRVLDNLSNGHVRNIKHLFNHPKFEFIEGDIRDIEICRNAMNGMDRVCHQAALGSVPRSINDPLTTNAVNIGGTLNVFFAAYEAGIKRVVYAASSSTYGDHPGLPKVEDRIGNPLSPYAVTKYANELYARIFGMTYGMELIGLRYFNVFGPRQNPQGPYAAVIPLFMNSLLKGISPSIYGDGRTSRDFTYVSNVVQINLNALNTDNLLSVNEVYNVAAGRQTSLFQLLQVLNNVASVNIIPTYLPERAGDVKHSLADIRKATELLGYNPEVDIETGVNLTWKWLIQNKEYFNS